MARAGLREGAPGSAHEDPNFADAECGLHEVVDLLYGHGDFRVYGVYTIWHRQVRERAGAGGGVEHRIWIIEAWRGIHRTGIIDAKIFR